jgi:hypothetical protein
MEMLQVTVEADVSMTDTNGQREAQLKADLELDKLLRPMADRVDLHTLKFDYSYRCDRRRTESGLGFRGVTIVTATARWERKESND